MSRRTRSAAKRGIDQNLERVLHDTDSERENSTWKRRKIVCTNPETNPTPAAASQLKTGSDAQSSSPKLINDGVIDDGDSEDVDESSLVSCPGGSIRGRERFWADIEEMRKMCIIGFAFQGFLLRNLKAGDDEGSIEFKVLSADEHLVVQAILLVSDPAEYPDHHTFYAFATSDAPPHISQVINEVSSGNSCSIKKTFEDLLSSIQKTSREHDDTEGEDEEYDVYDEDDNDFEINQSAQAPLTHKMLLQHDFLEVVAAGYRPGFVRFGVSDFSLSVSIPVIRLADDISPRALMAWDSRLLSRTQYLTLLISGLRGTYPPLESDGTYSQDAVTRGTRLQFKVGLTRRYKPSNEHAIEARRNFGLVNEAHQAWSTKEPPVLAIDGDGIPLSDEVPPEHEDEEEDEGCFDTFSLSCSLESLLDHSFVRIIQMRLKYGLGWAGAETLVVESEQSQQTADDVLATRREAIELADETEYKLTRSYKLPADPLTGREKMDDMNLPLVAFCYLVRRLTLCTRYCLVCHNKLNTNFEALKPYVCDSKLCLYQFYAFNRGPSLEYEICSNPATVDLLVSIAYTAAADGVLDEPLPTGMGLRVPVPDPKSCVPAQPVYASILVPAVAPAGTRTCVPSVPGPDGLCEFDEMDISEMRASITVLIDALPPIKEMKRYLESKVKGGMSKPKLKDMGANIPPAAWLILRWCVASCTAHLEKLTSDEDLVQNIDSAWHQFRFTIGAPDAEAKFKAAVSKAQKTDANARKYPSLYAFHGSPLRNWHSIIRHGLWFKTVAHGRSQGHGVYLAKDGSISMGGYASGSTNIWRQSQISPQCCVAVAEIVNQPNKFVCSNPYYVVNDTSWIVCRYLLVKATTDHSVGDMEESKTNTELSKIPVVKLDPAHPLTLTQGSGVLNGVFCATYNQKRIQFPEPSFKLDKLLTTRRLEDFEEDFDEEDRSIFE